MEKNKAHLQEKKNQPKLCGSQLLGTQLPICATILSPLHESKSQKRLCTLSVSFHLNSVWPRR